MLEEWVQWDPTTRGGTATHLLNFFIGEFLESHSVVWWMDDGEESPAPLTQFRDSDARTITDAYDWLNCNLTLDLECRATRRAWTSNSWNRTPGGMLLVE